MNVSMNVNMNVSMSALLAISSVDGRYADKTDPLRKLVSEYGLIYYRVRVELYWLLHLSDSMDLLEIPHLSEVSKKQLESMLTTFSLQDAEEIKRIEKITNHDVKAVEYFIKSRFENFGADSELLSLKEFVHFACTSEDINNLAYALMMKDVRDQVIMPSLKEVQTYLGQMSQQYASVPMMSRTHGQPATPTTLGKEFKNVEMRMRRQLIKLSDAEFLGKMNGAVGNFNAHCVAYPELDWIEIARSFVEGRLDLRYQSHSTQIEPHDYLAEYFHIMIRVNVILMDFSKDIWGYIALNYFTQKMVKGEIGSSTMPHKVNPIDFENAEGNLGIANALFSHFAEKLPISRWQRDLTDSTVLRTIGVGFAHTLIALRSILKGFLKLTVNEAAMLQDLQVNVEILGEAVQTVMRRYGIENPYEQLKSLTRGQKITLKDLSSFIEGLDIPKVAKARLLQLRPETYLGLAVSLSV